MVDSDNTHATVEYIEWTPTDWTPRQHTAALISLFSLTLACALTAGALTIWGTGSLALNTFVPMGVTLLTLGATLLTSVLWYAYRHAHNATGREPSDANGMLLVSGGIASVALVFQVISGIVVASGGGAGWQVFSALSYGLPAAIGGFVIFFLAMRSRFLTWRPTRDPTAPENGLVAPATGLRLLSRWLVTLLARDSWLMIWGAFAFDSDITNKLINNVRVDTQGPIAIFWWGAAVFLIAGVIEFLPDRQVPNATA